MFPRRTIVLGGARSGKSSFAENLVMSCNKLRIYIATAQAFDDEMGDRIASHKLQRGDDWRTIEEPLDASGALASIAAGEVALLDCATLWLSNQMLAENDLPTARTALIDALRSCAGDVVIVSNEVGQGIVPENAMARRFRDEQGHLNQQLAEWADLAVLVVAGLPMVLKGQLP